MEIGVDIVFWVGVLTSVAVLAYVGYAAGWAFVTLVLDFKVTRSRMLNRLYRRQLKAVDETEMQSFVDALWKDWRELHDEHN